MKFTSETRYEDLPSRFHGAFRKWKAYHSKTLAEVFWTKVDKRGPDECWPFKGGLHGSNFKYGLFYWRGGGKFRQCLAHRMSWILTNGEIPDGLWVLHRCDNPPCCNPAHLFLGTHQDNMADCKQKGRNFKPKGELSGAHRLTSQQVLEARSVYAKGGTKFSELAKRYGVAKCTIQNAVTGRKWKCLGVGVKPTKDNISRKLSNFDIARVREWRSLGWTQQDIATMFGVSQSCISSLLRGKTWAHTL